MSTSSEQTTLTVALIGNPNTGKSTLFNALVGIHQHVANYPGVTVEKKTGRMDHAGRRFEVIDLPGLYSLAPRSRDEMVAVDVLLGRRKDCAAVDAVVCIVDAGNLERNLYLVSQVLELELPTVVAVNMLDVAERHGIVLDLDRLQRQLPVPLVAIQANRRIGIAELKAALAEIVDRQPRRAESPFPEAFEREVTQLELLVAKQKLSENDQVGSGQSAVHQSSIINHQFPAACCGDCCSTAADTWRRRCGGTGAIGSAVSSGRPAGGWRPPAARCRRLRPRPATPGRPACCAGW